MSKTEKRAAADTAIGRETVHHRPSVAEIDLDRIQANFKVLRGLVDENAFFCPMIKANAYGHGDVRVAKALRAAGAEHLGVALIEEGLKLRENGDKGSLLVFGLFFDEHSAAVVLDNDLTPVLSEWRQLDVFEKMVAGRRSSKVRVHLKFNTGMNRLGFPPDQATKLRERLESPSCRLELAGVCTHLLRGDDAGVPTGDSHSQFEAFARILKAFKGIAFQAHALNSGGTAGAWKRSLNHVGLSPAEIGPLGARPGIAIYGVQPASEPELALPLEPVMSVKSRIMLVNKVPKGERLSYGATWIAKRDSIIGVVPFGYADGYFRALSNKGSVLCRGARVPVAGIVCMDYLMVDLTDVAKDSAIDIGEEVVLIGEQGKERILAHDIAGLAGTISYEVLTRVSERVPRVYKGGPR